MSRFAAALAGAALIAGCSTTPVVDTAALPGPSAEPAARPAMAGMLPSNSELVVRLTAPLSAEDTKVGDIFTAVVDEAVTAQNGEVILAAGTTATGIVTGVDDSDHAGDVAYVRLNFLRIAVGGTSHPFSVDITGTGISTPRGATTARTALGTVIPREEREAVLGNSLQAGAGTIIALGMGEVAAVLPEGTQLVVRTRDMLELR